MIRDLFKFIKGLFEDQPKEPIVVGREMFIIFEDMVLETANSPRDYEGGFYSYKTHCHSIFCRVAKLVEGGKSELEYSPEGFGIEILPGKYKLTSTTKNETLLFPIVLRKKSQNSNFYESVLLSKTKERRLRDWWDIKNVKSYYMDLILEKII